MLKALGHVHTRCQVFGILCRGGRWAYRINAYLPSQVTGSCQEFRKWTAVSAIYIDECIQRQNVIYLIRLKPSTVAAIGYPVYSWWYSLIGRTNIAMKLHLGLAEHIIRPHIHIPWHYNLIFTISTLRTAIGEGHIVSPRDMSLLWIQEAFEKCWAHSPLRAAAHRCPQQQQRLQQRQRVTEGTAMAS